MKSASTYTSRQPDERGVVAYTAEEEQIWGELYRRQDKLIQGRACNEYLTGLKTLGLTDAHIPQIPDINKRLQAATGWSVEPVPALIGYERFFNLLAARKFPAATFIRRREDFDYLQEPDIFHEIYGHCPLLTHKPYADFTAAYGALGAKADPKDHYKLATLYWFTVEFGLIQTHEGLRIYGGGILSSVGETVYALESDTPKREAFDIIEVLRTPYRIDIFQPLYYVIAHFDNLYDIINSDVFGAIEKARQMGMHQPLFQPKKDEESASLMGAHVPGN